MKNLASNPSFACHVWKVNLGGQEPGENGALEGEMPTAEDRLTGQILPVWFLEHC
jgi:hypothetical protein